MKRKLLDFEFKFIAWAAVLSILIYVENLWLALFSGYALMTKLFVSVSAFIQQFSERFQPIKFSFIGIL